MPEHDHNKNLSKSSSRNVYTYTIKMIVRVCVVRHGHYKWPANERKGERTGYGEY